MHTLTGFVVGVFIVMAFFLCAAWFVRGIERFKTMAVLFFRLRSGNDCYVHYPTRPHAITDALGATGATLNGLICCDLKPRHSRAWGFSLSDYCLYTSHSLTQMYCRLTPQRTGCFCGTVAPQERFAMNSDKARRWAEAVFKKEERDRDGRKAITEYEAQARATREKTARLKALRLAKEAQTVTAL